MARARGAGLPAHQLFRRGQRLDRVMFAAGQQAKKIAGPDDLGHARQLLELRHGVVGDARAVVRSAQHAAMQHARQFHVLHEGRAGQLGDDIAARQAAADQAGGARAVAGDHGDRHVERDAAGKLPVAHAGTRVGACAEHATFKRELAQIRTESRGGRGRKQAAGVGAGHAHRGATDLDRLAARRIPLVRRQAGMAGDDAQLFRGHAEFIRGDLRDRSDDALPQFDLAGKHADGLIRIDRDPLIQARIGREAGRQPAHWTTLL